MPPLPDPVALALADVLGDALGHGEEVAVPGLGVFRRRHEPGRLDQTPAGTVMRPPADVVEFVSDGAGPATRDAAGRAFGES